MNTSKSSLSGFVRPLIIGTIAGTVVTVAAMFVLAAVVSAAGLTEKTAGPLSSVAAGIGALIAGLVTSKLFGKRGLFMGLLGALALYLIVMFISLAVSPGGFSVLSLTRLMVMIIAGMAGGLWANREGGKRRKVI